MPAAALQEVLVVHRGVVLDAGEAAHAEANLAPPHDEDRQHLQNECRAYMGREVTHEAPRVVAG